MALLLRAQLDMHPKTCGDNTDITITVAVTECVPDATPTLPYDEPGMEPGRYETHRQESTKKERKAEVASSLP